MAAIGDAYMPTVRAAHTKPTTRSLTLPWIARRVIKTTAPKHPMFRIPTTFAIFA